MKIWILSSELFPYNYGGIGRYVDIYSHGLSKLGHEVVVWTYRPEGMSGLIKRLYKVIPYGPPEGWFYSTEKPDWTDKHPYYPYNILPFPLAHSYVVAESVCQYVNEHGPPDIIECQDYQALGYFLFQKKLLGTTRLEKTPIVLFAHTPDFIVRELNRESPWLFPYWWISELEKACYIMSDGIISPSQSLTDLLCQRMPALASKTNIIPLPLEEIQSNNPVNEPKDLTILYFGRIEWRKGILP